MFCTAEDLLPPLAARDLAGRRWSPRGTRLATALDGEREFLATRRPGRVQWRVPRAIRESLAIRGPAGVEWRRSRDSEGPRRALLLSGSAWDPCARSRRDDDVDLAELGRERCDLATVEERNPQPRQVSSTSLLIESNWS